MTLESVAIIAGLLFGGFLIVLAIWMTISSIIDERRAMREFDVETLKQRLKREGLLRRLVSSIDDIDKDVDHWRRQFARLDRVNDELRHLGYPGRSPCFVTGGETARFNDWAETTEASMWRQNAKAMGAIIQGLSEYHREVVEIIYLGRKNASGHSESSLINALKDAEPGIIVAMRKRNII